MDNYENKINNSAILNESIIEKLLNFDEKYNENVRTFL